MVRGRGAIQVHSFYATSLGRLLCAYNFSNYATQALFVNIFVHFPVKLSMPTSLGKFWIQASTGYLAEKQFAMLLEK